MARIMPALVQLMTDGEIENLVEKLRAAARKHRNEFSSDAVQQALGVENLGMKLLEPFRKLVEDVAGVIVHHVTVDRSRTPQETLDATGCKQYTNPDVVETMPRGE